MLQLLYEVLKVDTRWLICATTAVWLIPSFMFTAIVCQSKSSVMRNKKHFFPIICFVFGLVLWDIATVQMERDRDVNWDDEDEDEYENDVDEDGDG